MPSKKWKEKVYPDGYNVLITGISWWKAWLGPHLSLQAPVGIYSLLVWTKAEQTVLSCRESCVRCARHSQHGWMRPWAKKQEVWDGELCRVNDKTSRKKELLDLPLVCKRNTEPWGSHWSWCQHKGANLCYGFSPAKVLRRLSHGMRSKRPFRASLSQHSGHSTTGLVGPILALHGLKPSGSGQPLSPFPS